jgi:hypothetical protein
MKTIIQLLILFLTINTHAFGQDCIYYEYKITSEKENDGVTGYMKCYNMNGNSRVESVIKTPEMPKSLSNSNNLSMTNEPDKIFMLIPSAKIYSEVSFAKFNERPKSEDDYDIEFLGNEFVNGYNTTHIVYRTNSYISGKKQTDLWISKGVPGFSGFIISRANQFFNDEGLFKTLIKRGAEGIPVRIKTTEFGTTVLFDLVAAEKREADPSFFKIPAEYTAATSAKLNSAQEVMEDMHDMSKEEVEEFLQKLKKKYKLE